MGHISLGTIIVVLSIAGFIYFMFKIYGKNNESNSLRYGLYMAIVGIVIIILSQTIFSGIKYEYNDSVRQLRTTLLICGLIYTLYGGMVSINKFLKDKKD